MANPADMALLFQQLTDTLKNIANQNANPNKQNSDLFATINSQLSEFIYNPEADLVFEIWHERYGPFLESDGQSLPDEMKTRLLVGKLGAQEYARFTESILPQKPTDLSYNVTLQKAPTQSPIDFAAQVSAQCERAQMTLTKEEIKALVFISGLSSSDRDLRERCLKMMEEDRAKNTDIKFERLVEECRAILSLRSAAAALEHPGHGWQANSISVKPQREKERQGRQRQFSTSSRIGHFNEGRTRSQSANGRQSSKPRPPFPCKWCGGSHWNNECDNKRGPKCYNCDRVGHFARECRSKKKANNNDSMSVMNVSDDTDGWITVDCVINGRPVSLVADTAARKTIIQTPIWEKLGKPKFKTGQTFGKSYSGHNFELIGSFDCTVEFAGIKLELECFVAPTGALNLFGLPWIRAFELALQRPIATTLHIVQPEATFMATSSSADLASKVKQKFPEVFSDELGHPSSTEVYERLHMDFAGPCADGNKYLVVVDSYSKWPEVIKMNTTTAKMLIEKFVWLFSRYGFPKEIVTDNGPPFKSNEISQFCRKHGIKQTFSPPFHPQSNGRAERFVDTLKRQMKKCARDDAHWVQNSLLTYRSTPNASLNGRTPAELFLGRPVRTILSLVKPQENKQDKESNDKYRQRMVKQFNQHHGTHERKFGIGDQVQFINYQHGTKTWLKGMIESGNGVVWKVRAPKLNAVVTRHSNQMRKFYPIPYKEHHEQLPDEQPQQQPPNDQPEEVQPKSPRRVRFADELNEPLERAQSPPTVRRSTRERKAPKILNPDASKAKYDYI